MIVRMCKGTIHAVLSLSLKEYTAVDRAMADYIATMENSDPDRAILSTIRNDISATIQRERASAYLSLPGCPRCGGA